MKAAFKKDTPQSIINEVKSVLKKFWESILRLLGKTTKTIGDEWSSLDAIIRMPLRDLLNQDFEKVMRVAEDESDAQVEGHIVEDKDDVKLQKAPEDAEAPSEFDVAVRDKLINDFLKPAGLDISTDIAEGETNGNGDVKLSKGKRKAAETAPLIPKEGSPADISSADGAKIQKNLDSLAEKLEKVSTIQKKFLDDTGIALEAEQDGSKSWYKTFITKKRSERL